MSLRLQKDNSDQWFNLFLTDGTDNSAYKFEFINELTDEVITTYLIDNSSYPDTYSKFNLSSSGVNLQWVEDDDNGLWSGIDINETGQYQTKVDRNGYIKSSNDYGETWVASIETYDNNWVGVSINDDGSKQVAVSNSNKLYMSIDYGNSWLISLSSKDGFWVGVDISGDGKYITGVLQDEKIQRSDDYGETWTEVGVVASFWKDISMSTSGQYQYAASYGEGVYKSDDYGETWTKVIDDSKNYFSISTSDTGEYVSTCVWDGYVYKSDDYGETWSEVAESKRWSGISISKTGKEQVICDFFGYLSSTKSYIHISNDYGETWSQTSQDDDYKSIAISGNGEFITSVVWSGNTYRTTYSIIDDFDLGWYKYNVYNNDDELIKFGMCYIFDEQGDPGNSPDVTEYTETKTKYVYKK